MTKQLSGQDRMELIEGFINEFLRLDYSPEYTGKAVANIYHVLLQGEEVKET